jgi:pyruvate ferredoxin oxidoreductase alpha subunit
MSCKVYFHAKGGIEMGERIAMTGDETAAFAMRQIEPDVVAAYPITPQTEIVMKYSQYVADGKVATEMIPVESEHSAMSACVGASAAGARTMTATAANGLALMWEVLYIAASLRQPIVMSVVNRALSAPINIHCDHSDSMGARDSGWIQLYSENAREVYENLILAIRIAEHPDIQLPVMVCQDGFITSHAVEAVEVFDTDAVRAFTGTRKPELSLLDTDHPATFGPLDLQDYYFEHKRQQIDAMQAALTVIPRICDEFRDAFGPEKGFMESYRTDDAELVLVVLSSTAGTAKDVVDQLREEGAKAGLLKPCILRPFPAEQLRRALQGSRAVAVLDRSETFSTMGGPLFTELRSALYGDGAPSVYGFVYGLGGREIYPADIRHVFETIRDREKPKDGCAEIGYLGVRE